MSRANIIARAFGLFFLMLISVFAVSCGSGGGISTTDTGSVSLTLTDDPMSEFSKMMVTIDRAELVSGDDRVPLYSGEKTFDLLALDGESALFSVSTGVPTGFYDKITLSVTSIKLVRPDSTYEIPELKGGGKLDLNPREDLFVTPEGNLVVHLDMDAAKSVQVVNVGGSDRYIFRPVVFVKAHDPVDPGTVLKVSGAVSRLNSKEGTFSICPEDTTFESAKAAEPKSTGGCVPVYTSDGTSFFDSNGEPVDFSYLTGGDTVMVAGKVRPGDTIAVDASVVEAGESVRLTGTITATADSTGVFTLQTDPGQAVSGEITVSLQDGTAVYDKDGVELDAGSVAEGAEATVSVFPVGDGTYRATVVIIEAEPVETVSLEGYAFSPNYSERTLDLVRFGEDTVCVTVPPDAEIYLVQEIDGTFTNTAMDFSEIRYGQQVEVFGVYDDTGCLAASTILAQPYSGGI